MGPQDTQHFPTFGEWLSSHDDSTIADLLHRLLRHGSADLVGHLTSSDLGAHASSAFPALSHLSGVELAILHAASELDAAHHPCTLDDLHEALEELFDISGTPESERPNPAGVHATLESLCRWGLVFGPDCRLDAFPDLTDRAVRTEFQFRVPPMLPSLFEPATQQLWRLVDCGRCPIPSADIPGVVSALPARQRRLLTTLVSAGGVGHSASLSPSADPNKPLPTLVRLGILDQLDDTTARLSGRVQQHLRDTLLCPPGGVFAGGGAAVDVFADGVRAGGAAAEAGNDDATASSPADSVGAAQAIQVIQDLAEAARDLGAGPLTPLASGGLGAREINKAARRRNLDAERTEQLFNWLFHAGLMGFGRPRPLPSGMATKQYWALTERGVEFTAAEPARAWALLLWGWSASTYVPWLQEERGAKPFEQLLHAPEVGSLRGLFPLLFSPVRVASVSKGLPGGEAEAGAASPLNPAAEDMRDTLWRLRPWQAWNTTSETWDRVWREAQHLGLLAPQRTQAGESLVPTGAMLALAETLRELNGAVEGAEGGEANGEASTEARTEADRTPIDRLTDKLRRILPAPVDSFILQADLTIMVPGLLSPEDSAMLQRFATQESGGMASVWRITKDSLDHALRSGETPETLEAYLDAHAMGGANAVPQSLRYLISDAARGLSLATAGIASTYLHASDPAVLDHILALPVAEGCQLRRIAPTVLVSTAQLSFITDRLEGAGVHIHIEDGSIAGVSEPTLARVPGTGEPEAPAGHTWPGEPRAFPAPDQPTTDEAEALVRGIIADFRAAQQELKDTFDANDPAARQAARTPKAMLGLLKSAYTSGALVEVTFVGSDNSVHSDRVSVVMMSPSTIAVISEVSGESFTLQPHRLVAVK